MIIAKSPQNVDYLNLFHQNLADTKLYNIYYYMINWRAPRGFKLPPRTTFYVTLLNCYSYTYDIEVRLITKSTGITVLTPSEQ